VGFGALVHAGGPAFLIVLSRNVEAGAVIADEVEYKALETTRNSTMEKEINQAAKEGYRFFLASLGNVVLMARNRGKSQPRYEYKLLKLKKQGEEEELRTQSQLGYDYRATVTGTGGVTVLFELDSQAGTNSDTREYKLLKFPAKDEEKENFQKEMSGAVAAGLRVLD